MTDKITVAGQLVGQSNITLFLTDGTSRVLSQDSWNTKAISSAILPGLARHEMVEIDLDSFSLAEKLQAIAPNIKLDEAKRTVALPNGTLDANGLMKHIEGAVFDAKNAKGFKTFMGYVNESIRRRRHSIEEFMEFLKLADLPIADDGYILGYKILQKNGQNGEFVDHHSHQVKQRLGSLVYMPESKIDQTRALCSTGLHIAARPYLRSFWYTDSVLTLVKIRPGDVVSVPAGETSKMRVAAYHIVKVFSDEDAAAIVNSAKFADLPKAARLLAEAVVGNHSPIIERVKVTGKGQIEVTQNEKAKPRVVKPIRDVTKIAERRVDPVQVKQEVKKLQEKQGLMGRIKTFFGFGQKAPEIAKPVDDWREVEMTRDINEMAADILDVALQQRDKKKTVKKAKKVAKARGAKVHPKVAAVKAKAKKVAKKPAKKQPEPIIAFDPDDRQARLAAAQKDFDAGMSIREISKKHGLDRKMLGNKLDRSKKTA